MTHALETRDLRFHYLPGQHVLEGVSVACDAGKLMMVLGPNGSGKTTLLRCLMGWLKPVSGEVLLHEKPLSAYSGKALARNLAYVPQFPTSAFAFPVRELILMGRYAHTGALGLASKADIDVARQAMIMTETLDFADRSLSELSGGQAQCVSLARALAQQPTVLLLDEPTSHLDMRNQLKVHRMMQRLAHEWGLAVLCVSHDVNLAARFADELVLMREGKVLAAGVPTEVVRKDVLDRVYDVDSQLVDVPGQSVPVVIVR